MATYVTRTSASGGEFDLPGTDTGEAGQVNILDAAATLVATDVEAALAEIRNELRVEASTELTIDGAGAITATQSYHRVDTAADAATDNLDTINGLVDGQFCVLRLENAARNVVIRSSVGNIFCEGARDVTLDAIHDVALLFQAGANVLCFAVKGDSLQAGGLGLALASSAAGSGLSLIGVEDAAGSLAAANAEAAVAELALPPTLTPAAEAANVISVAFQGPAHVAQYLARAYDTNGLQVAAAFTVAETGAGAEVFGSGTPTLLFTTDAAGAAAISVTDVAGASGKMPLLVVESASASAGAKAAPTSAIVLTFDGV